VIPFIALLLRDLTFLNDGNPKMIKRNVFNFSKLRRIAGVCFFFFFFFFGLKKCFVLSSSS